MSRRVRAEGAWNSEQAHPVPEQVEHELSCTLASRAIGQMKMNSTS